RVPAVGGEPRGHVFTEGQVGLPFNRDSIVVVDPAEIAELEVPANRGRLTRNPLQRVAVAADRIDAVVEHLESGAIEDARHPATRQRHPDAVGNPLPEWTGRRLDSRRPAILRMTRALAVELTKTLDVVESDRGLAPHFVLA